MKGLLSIVIVVTTISVYAQSPSEPDRLVDEYALTETSVGELETQRLQLDQYLKKPLDLNRALPQELEELGLLSPLQIDSWIRFREQFGFAESWYVFQAVPGWNQALVERLRPYCKLGGRKQTFHHFLHGRTDQFVLTRLYWSTKKERVNQAVGGNVHRLWRYKIQSEAGWSGGVLMENDAGERFGTRGPDFLSAFLQFKQDGRKLRVLLGDYSVQFGQGLICWQGMSFGMGTDLVGIKRQGQTVRPYQSVGESRFMRGVAVGHMGNSVHWDVFVSRNAQTATRYSLHDLRSAFRQVDASGLHRTPTELAKKNTVTEFTLGGRMARIFKGGRLGLNLATRSWNIPRFQVSIFSDTSWQQRVSNASVDVCFTRGKMHAFGEWAVDQRGRIAVVGGSLWVIDRRIDISMHARSFGVGFSAVDGDPLRRSANGDGEQGYYVQVRFRINDRTSLDLYSDRFTHRSAANGLIHYIGQVQGWRWHYQADKKNSIYVRFQSIQQDQEGDVGSGLPGVQLKQHWGLRVHGDFFISNSSRFQLRMEKVYAKQGGSKPAHGFLSYLEWGYSPAETKLNLDLRLQWVSTTDWQARIYAYERNVLYKVGFPAFAGTGWRVYANFSVPAGRKIQFWVRVAVENIVDNQLLNEVSSSIRPEYTLQLRYQWSRRER